MKTQSKQFEVKDIAIYSKYFLDTNTAIQSMQFPDYRHYKTVIEIS